MAEYILKNNIKNVPFTEWINDKIEVHAFYYNSKLVVINSICPHFGGELYFDKEKKKILCNFHNLEFCPVTFKSDHQVYKKIIRYKVIDLDPIKIKI